MPTGIQENITRDDDFLEDNSEWVEPASQTRSETMPGKKNPPNGRKWKTIEEYREQKRLRDALQDYTTDDN